MKTFLLLCALLLAAPALAAPAAYSLVIEDLPLMPGMTEKPETAVVFDSPAGRIAGTVAETTSAETDIIGFYAEALPPLGWTARPPAGFVRDGEALTIEIEQKNGAAFVHFNLTPGK